MSEFDEQALSEALGALWMRAINEKHFQDAMLIGVLMYLVFRDGADLESREGALGLIQSAVDALLHDGKERRRSFSLKRPPEVRLVGGANALICNECAHETAAYFRKNDE
jgi:hypothetical protein